MGRREVLCVQGGDGVGGLVRAGGGGGVGERERGEEYVKEGEKEGWRG